MTRPIRFRIPEKLPPEVLSTFRDLIRKTEETGREHTASLCVDEQGHLFIGEVKEGTEAEGWTDYPPSCRVGVNVGLFHTHPNALLFWSGGDALEKILRNEINPNYRFNCLGSPGQSYILCHVLLKKTDAETARSLSKRYLDEWNEIGIHELENPTYSEVLKDILYRLDTGEIVREHTLEREEAIEQIIRKAHKALILDFLLGSEEFRAYEVAHMSDEEFERWKRREERNIKETIEYVVNKPLKEQLCDMMKEIFGIPNSKCYFIIDSEFDPGEIAKTIIKEIQTLREKLRKERRESLKIPAT